jgi:hypothetical protein
MGQMENPPKSPIQLGEDPFLNTISAPTGQGEIGLGEMGMRPWSLPKEYRPFPLGKSSFIPHSAMLCSGQFFLIRNPKSPFRNSKTTLLLSSGNHG